MKCSNCGLETARGNFCEHCGARLEKNSPLKNFYGRKSKWIIAPIFILFLAIAGYVSVTYMTSPQRVVKKYFGALEMKNYSGAYQLIKPSRERTLDKKAFIAWQKNEEKKNGSIREFIIKENVLFDNEAKINVKVRRNKSKFTQSSLKVVRTGSYLGVFQKWQIELPQDERNFSVLYRGASLFLDGFDTGIKSNIDGISIQVYQGNHTIELKGQNARDYLVKSNDIALSVSMKPIDQITKEINQDAQKYYDLIFEAYNTGSMDKLSTYFGPHQLKQLNSDFNEKRRYKMVLNKINKPVDTFQAEIIAPDKVVVFMKFPFDGGMLDYNTQKPKKYNFVLGISRVTYTFEYGRWIMKLENQP